MRIKLFGERNTGTNYVFKLLEMNLRVRVDAGVAPRWFRLAVNGNERAIDAYFRATERRNLGWKHRSVRPLLGRGRLHDWVIVVVTKNPYAWLLSMHGRPYHRSERSASLEQFIESPWTTVCRETGPKQYENVIEMWNEKSAAHLSLVAQTRGLMVRYEDLLLDAKTALEHIADLTTVPLERPFRNVDNSTKGDGKRLGDYRHYYLGERWRARLPPRAIAAVNRSIEPRLVRALGYEVLMPPGLSR